MTSERWLRVKEIYHAACDLAPPDCAAFLTEACGADAGLRREVESLLAEDGSRAGILATAATSVAAAGKQFGPYRIEASIGKGGMGEVWKARDSRLNRDVAIKISAQQFTGRFEREARAIAALNHPHVCQIYDVGPDYIVMEFVDGTPLKGPMPVEKALALAIQLASALDAAHRGGVTHRDLKPANVLVTKSGVKVLDFGLAKLEEPMTAVPDDPTIQGQLTATGMVMGTPPYMSPEQVMGKPADARSDIFAFGCVLYELLTGKRAFVGDSSAAVMGAVMEREVATVEPPALDRVVQRCLAKDPEDRWQSARDLKIGLELVGGTGLRPAVVLKTRSWLPWAIAGACALGLTAVSFLHFREKPPQTNPVQFILDPPADNQYTYPTCATAISPDGRYLVFGAAQAGSAATHLWLRPVGSLDARVLPGTEYGNFPFWSPDSKSIAFFADNKVKRLDIAGGAPLVLCDTASGQPVYGGAWNEEGAILSAGKDGLHRVGASGGVSTLLTKSDPARNESGHTEPQFFPGGKRFLYFIGSSEASIQGVYVGSLDRPQERTKILATDHKAIYTPQRNGHPGALLWLREQTLMAQDFDAATLRLSGDPASVAENIAALFGANAERASFWASDSGLLVYRTGGIPKSRLVWMSRDGKRLEEAAPEDKYGALALSPDGKRLAFALYDSANKGDIWIYDLSRKIPTRLTFGPEQKAVPVWSPDGRFIAYGSTRNGVTQLYRKDAGGSGTEEQLTSGGPGGKSLTQWSADGKYLAFNQTDPKTGADIMALPAEPDASGHRVALPLLQMPFAEGGGVISPNGKWLAYHSNESGAYQVYIQAFPMPAGKWRVSNNGGTRHLWRGDGKEIFYERQGVNRSAFMAAGIRTGPKGVDVDSPRELFSVLTLNSSFTRPWLVTPDGQRFLIEEPTDVTQVAPLTVLQNWQDALKK